MSSFHKTKTWKSKAYLENIRSRPCIVTGSTQNVIAHHVRMFGHGGTGLKPHDYLCVPLDDTLHKQLHNMGEREFWAKHDIDIGFKIVCEMIVFILSERSVDKQFLDHMGELVRGISTSE